MANCYVHAGGYFRGMRDRSMRSWMELAGNPPKWLVNSKSTRQIGQAITGKKKFVWQTRFFFRNFNSICGVRVARKPLQPVLWSTNTALYLYSFWPLFILYEVELDNKHIRFILNNTDYFLYLLMRNSLHVASDVLKHSFVFFKFNAALIIWRFRPMMLDPKRIMTFTDAMQKRCSFVVRGSWKSGTYRALLSETKGSRNWEVRITPAIALFHFHPSYIKFLSFFLVCVFPHRKDKNQKHFTVQPKKWPLRSTHSVKKYN